MCLPKLRNEEQTNTVYLRSCECSFTTPYSRFRLVANCRRVGNSCDIHVDQLNCLIQALCRLNSIGPNDCHAECLYKTCGFGRGHMYGSARGRQILQYKINPNPNPYPNTNPSSPYCIMRFIFGSRVHVPSSVGLLYN